MNNLPNFSDFYKTFEEKKKLTTEKRNNTKLISVTEEYHNAQIELQKLEKSLIETDKENIAKREELKKAIIEKKRDIKEKQKSFNKFLGDEDIKDLKI
jgi:hypothetical protein